MSELDKLLKFAKRTTLHTAIVIMLLCLMFPALGILFLLYFGLMIGNYINKVGRIWDN
jgi:ABC-type nickel/cobalt efflux system permease component RcnA